MADEGAPTSLRKDAARDEEEEDAAAATACWISWTSRLAGFVRRSFVNAERVVSEYQEISSTLRWCTCSYSSCREDTPPNGVRFRCHGAQRFRDCRNSRQKELQKLEESFSSTNLYLG